MTCSHGPFLSIFIYLKRICDSKNDWCWFNLTRISAFSPTPQSTMIFRKRFYLNVAAFIVAWWWVPVPHQLNATAVNHVLKCNASPSKKRPPLALTTARIDCGIVPISHATRLISIQCCIHFWPRSCVDGKVGHRL